MLLVCVRDSNRHLAMVPVNDSCPRAGAGGAISPDAGRQRGDTAAQPAPAGLRAAKHPLGRGLGTQHGAGHEDHHELHRGACFFRTRIDLDTGGVLREDVLLFFHLDKKKKIDVNFNLNLYFNFHYSSFALNIYSYSFV